tara:strand:+ start:1674 stop:2717 length:1044 start_codon:yes stop_codon:yes gene_type:complete
MKAFYSLIILLIPFIGFGQSIYSKDNINLGDKQEFINACISSGEKFININGIEIKMTSYCSCACDNLIPQLYSWEMIDAVGNNKLIELFSKEKNLKILLDCATSNVEISDNYNFGYKSFEKYSESELSIMIESCVIEAESNADVKELFTNSQIYSYCSCSIEKLINEGYSMGQLKKIEDENSEVYNEITLPCIEDFLIEEENTDVLFNEYVKEDISGNKYMTEIKLIDFLGNGYKIKINIDGVVKYFLFDTGASDLIIDSDMERELIFNGSIKKDDYLDEQEFILADNSTVMARVVRLNNIKIGDFVVDNVIVSVIDGGSLLCGLGLLNKFRKWDFIKDSETLIIYK